MQRAPLVWAVSIFAIVSLFCVPFAPSVARAQNICDVANAECPEDLGPDTGLVPCACPLIGIATIVGVCIAPLKCQETGIIPTPTTAGLLLGGGLAAGGVFSLLSGGSPSGSEGSSQFNGGLATAELAPELTLTTDGSLAANATTAKDDGLGTLIADLGKKSVNPALTTGPPTSCVLPSTGSTPIDQLKQALPAPAPSCLI